MNPYKHLFNQAKRCLVAESKLSPEQRSMHQWMMLVSVGSKTITIGKGGANTCFYNLTGKDVDRKICHPEDLLSTIEVWAKDYDNNRYVEYFIVSPKGKKHGPYASLESARKKTPPVRHKIVGHTKSGDDVVLYSRKSSLQGNKWVVAK